MTEKRLSTKDRQPLSEVVERVWIALQAENRKPKTIHDYKEKVGAFAGWARRTLGRDVLIADYTLANAQAYLAARLLGTGGCSRLAPSSAASHVRVLRAVGVRLFEAGATGTHRLQSLAEPTVRPTEVRPKNVRAPVLAKLLVATASLPRTGRRNELILSLLFDVGPRVSELVAINREEVFLDQGWVLIGSPAKNGGTRILPLGRTTHRLLRAHLGRSVGTGPLLMGERGVRMTSAAVRQALARLSEKARVPRVFPHAFRHEASAWYTANGAPDSAKNAVFGWTTARKGPQEANYTVLTNEQVVTIHRRLSPLDQLQPTLDASRRAA